MKHLNPYAPPQSQDLREAPYARFVRLSYAATVLGALCAVLITLATHSLLYGCAVVCASLMLHFLLAALIAWLTETLAWSEPEAMDHHKVSMPEPRHQSRHRTTTAAGFTIAQVMWGITAILGAHALLVLLHFIAFAVFGASEPRW
ncbi:MAG: hypothetical protein WAW39_15945 [Prosthecobacter sp.]|uniref:hypothetical protein n=1 Tax=Prosthecobacter sp. TaxID=1965333 RepID=UPI003BB141CC